MVHTPSNLEQSETTRAELRSMGFSITIRGSALAVVALVAVIGLIWMGLSVIEVNRHALARSMTPVESP
jgi:hypothetical protein